MATVGFALLGQAAAGGLGLAAGSIGFGLVQAGFATVGALLDSVLLARMAGPQKGPRLDSTRSGGYDEGGDAMRVLGKGRVAGQVIWQSELREKAKTTSSGLFGTVKLVNYDYFRDVAVAFTRQPSELEEPAEQIWAQGVLIYDKSATPNKTSGLITIEQADTLQQAFSFVALWYTFIKSRDLIYIHNDPTKVVYNFFSDFIVKKGFPLTVTGAAEPEHNGTFEVLAVYTDYLGVLGQSAIRVVYCDTGFKQGTGYVGTCHSDVIPEAAPGPAITFQQDKPEQNPQTVLSITQYNGQQDQMPDPVIELFEGEGNVPAFRGTGYIVFKNLNVSRWGGATPQFEALWKQREATTVQQAILDIIRPVDKVDVATQIDVTDVTGGFVGMVITPSMSPAEALQQVMLVHDIEAQSVMKVLPNGERISGLKFFDRELGSRIPVLAEHRGAGDYDSDTLEIIQSERKDPNTSPLMVSVSFMDTTRDYQPGLRSYRRQPNVANRTYTLNLTMALGPGDADALAKKVAWFFGVNELNAVKVNLPPNYFAVQEGDRLVVDNLSGTEMDVRVGMCETGANYVKAITGYQDYAGAYIQTGVAGIPNYGGSLSIVPEITFFVLDLPAVRAEAVDATVLTAVASVASPGAGFPGATYFVSLDGGASFYQDITTGVGGAIGRIVEDVGGGVSGRFYDTTNSILFETFADTPALFSAPESVVAAGTANWLVVGFEIIGFCNVTQIAPRLYRLTKLLRGRRNTERFIGTHPAGLICAIVSDSSAVFLDMGLAAYGQYRAITAVVPDEQPTEESIQDFHFVGGASRRPFAPALRSAVRAVDGAVTVNWRRRTRSFFRLLGGVVAPLDEPTAQYVLRIMSAPGGTVLRTFNISGATSQVYTAAQQTVDFGGLEASIDIELWQVSATIGAGNVLVGVI